MLCVSDKVVPVAGVDYKHTVLFDGKCLRFQNAALLLQLRQLLSGQSGLDRLDCLASPCRRYRPSRLCRTRPANISTTIFGTCTTMNNVVVLGRYREVQNDPQALTVRPMAPRDMPATARLRTQPARRRPPLCRPP